VRGGQSLVIFPGGRLARAPGLRPFHMGAFVVAAETGVPVVPVAIRGTRTITRTILRPEHHIAARAPYCGQSTTFRDGGPSTSRLVSRSGLRAPTGLRR
jgi:hypothetical protein